MLIERDPETGEIVRRLIDKKKRVKVSALKKAINKYRKEKKADQQEESA